MTHQTDNNLRSRTDSSWTGLFRLGKLRQRIAPILALCLLLGATLCIPMAQADSASPSLAAGSPTVTAIAGDDFMARSHAIKALILHPPADAAIVLHALDQGRLYVEAKPVARLGIADDTGKITAIDSKEIIGTSSDAQWQSIQINNAIRIKLRPRLDLMALQSSDVSKRRDAAQDLFSARLSPDYIQELKLLEPQLKDEHVLSNVRKLVAGFELNDADPKVRLTAIADVADALDPEIRAKLANLASNDKDPAVKAAAAKTLAAIDTRVAGWQFLQNLVFGLSLGSVLLLAAIGLAITFGVMGVINMAHGEMMMIGAYTTWLLQQLMPNHLTAALFLAIPSAFLAAGIIGMAIERGLIRFLYGRPLETLLATFGLSLMLQQAARIIFTPLNRAVTLPDFMSNSWVVNPVFAITYNRLYILIFSLTVFFGLLLLLKRSTFGLRIRAVAQNRAMARACGVRSNWIDALTFGLGSGIAGIAGVALAQITNVGPNLGQSYIVDSFMVVVLGGVGNLWGTLVAGMGIGVLNKFLEPYSGAVLAKVVVLVLVILVIQKRPRGLFPQKGRAAEE
jgi:urea transport system permease protein